MFFFLLAGILAVIGCMTKFYLLAYIAIGIAGGAIIMGLMTDHGILSGVVTILVAIAVPVLYLIFHEIWIVYVSYIFISMVINADAILDCDQYDEYTIEGKLYRVWNKEASDNVYQFLIFFFMGLWVLFALIVQVWNVFLIVPSLYLIIRSVILIVHEVKENGFQKPDLGDAIRTVGLSYKRLARLPRLSSYDGEFSAWAMILSLILLAASIALAVLESTHTYSGTLEMIANSPSNLWNNSMWFPGTQWLCEVMVDDCNEYAFVVQFLAFFGMLVAAVLEAALTVVWLLLLFVYMLLAVAVMWTCGLAVPPLISVGLLVVTIMAFVRERSDVNRWISILCFLVSVVCCVIYFYYFIPIIQF